MYDDLHVTVVIPALNEAESIGLVLDDVPAWVDEVIVADNGSTDATAARARARGARVVHERRRGYGRACLAGMAAMGRCDVVVFLDGDYSDYPDQMARLVAPIASGQADMVIGSRTRGAHTADAFTAPQRFGTGLACWLMGLFWPVRPTDLGPFRAIRYGALRWLGMVDPTYGWTIEMQIKAAEAGLAVREVPVSYRARIGTSKISGTVRGVIGAGYKILATIGRYALLRSGRRARRPDRVIVFTRLPLPGCAKTRLIPALGAAGAAELQRRMAELTYATARCAGPTTDVEIRYVAERPFGTDARLRRWLGGGLLARPQGSGDLGERMARAMSDAFDEGCRRVVIVGTDCPALSARDLQAALAALAGHDLVIGPSEDGGYWLIGARRPVDVFAGVDWSTDRVRTQTLERARAQGLSVHQLRCLADVDTPESLDAALSEWPACAASGPQWARPWLSVIVPARDEADCIQAAVRSARAGSLSPAAAPADVEVIVADGGSEDDTAARARQAGATVISCPPGRARQMNAAARVARGQVLLFLHADTILPPNYLTPVFAALADPRVVGGSFTFRTDLPGAFMRAAHWLVAFRTRYLRMPYGDQAIFVRRDTFERVGGFPDVPIAEDLQFVRRLRRRGTLAVLDMPAVTSGRRWRRVGKVKTMLVNRTIALGCLLGVRPEWLARLHRWASR